MEFGRNELRNRQQRIAIIATLYFIRRGEFDDMLKISEILLHYHHEWIHKAVGWMLREVSSSDKAIKARCFTSILWQGEMKNYEVNYFNFPHERR